MPASIAQYRGVKAGNVVGDREFLAERVLRINRVVEDLERAEGFYRDVLGFCSVARGPLDAATASACHFR